jgi:hypothetical protein
MLTFGQIVNLLENRIKKSWSILGTLMIWIIFSMSGTNNFGEVGSLDDKQKKEKRKKKKKKLSPNLRVKSRKR